MCGLLFIHDSLIQCGLLFIHGSLIQGGLLSSHDSLYNYVFLPFYGSLKYSGVLRQEGRVPLSLKDATGRSLLRHYEFPLLQAILWLETGGVHRAVLSKLRVPFHAAVAKSNLYLEAVLLSCVVRLKLHAT